MTHSHRVDRRRILQSSRPCVIDSYQVRVRQSKSTVVSQDSSVRPLSDGCSTAGDRRAIVENNCFVDRCVRDGGARSRGALHAPHQQCCTVGTLISSSASSEECRLAVEASALRVRGARLEVSEPVRESQAAQGGRDAAVGWCDEGSGRNAGGHAYRALRATRRA